MFPFSLNALFTYSVSLMFPSFFYSTYFLCKVIPVSNMFPLVYLLVLFLIYLMFFHIFPFFFYSSYLPILFPPVSLLFYYSALALLTCSHSLSVFLTVLKKFWTADFPPSAFPTFFPSCGLDESVQSP